MARLVIDTGQTPNDGTGDALKTAFDKTNSNFQELYNDLSAANTSLSTRIDNLIISVAGASVLSADVASAVGVLDNAISVISAAAAAEVSNRISAVGNASARLQSAINTVSANIDVVSLGLVSVNNKVDNIDVGAVATASAALQSAINTVSQQVSVLSARVNTNSSQMTSADNALSQAISVISQQVSILSARVNTNSSQMTSADNALSVAINVVSNALSNEISVRAAADNSISAAVNVVSNRISAIMTSSQSFSGSTYTYSGNIVNTASNNGTIVVSGSGGIGVGGNITAAGAVVDSIGNLRNIPANDKSADYTLLATDNGKHINITSGNVTVPASVFSSGNAVTIFNNSASSAGVVQGASVTLRQAGTASTGNRTLAQYGLCTVLCVGANVFVISGVGLS